MVKYNMNLWGANPRKTFKPKKRPRRETAIVKKAEKRPKEKKKIYFGIVNPSGLKNGSNSTMLEKSQLKKAAKILPGTRMYIGHFVKKPNKNDIFPCGRILESYLDEKTGNLWASFVIFDTKNGLVAHELLDRDTKHKMTGLSIGYDYRKNTVTDVVDANRITEVSICQVPCTRDAYIKGSKTIKEYLGIKANKNILKKEEKKEKLNETNDQIKNEKKKEDMVYIEDEAKKNLIRSAFMSNEVNQVPQDQYEINSAAAGQMQVDQTNQMNVDNPNTAVTQQLQKIVQQGDLDAAHLPNANPDALALQQQQTQPPAVNKRPREELNNAALKLMSALKALTQEEVEAKIPPAEPVNMNQINEIDSKFDPETAKVFKEAIAENQRLKEELKTVDEATKKQILQDSVRLKNEIDTLAPWLIKTLADVDTDGLLIPQATEMLQRMVKEPGNDATTVTEVLKAAASAGLSYENCRAKDALAVEQAHQEKLKMKAEMEKLTKAFNEQKELIERTNANAVLFQTPEERYATKAPIQVQSVGAGQFGRKQARTNSTQEMFGSQKPLTPQQRFANMQNEALRRSKYAQRTMFPGRNFL